MTGEPVPRDATNAVGMSATPRSTANPSPARKSAKRPELRSS